MNNITHITSNNQAINSIEDFISLMLPAGGNLQIAWIHPSEAKPVTAQSFFIPQETHKLIEMVFNGNGQGFNIYWTPNPLLQPLNWKPKEADMAAAKYAFTDNDPDLTIHKTYKAAKPPLMAQVNAIIESDNPPTLVIDSGNGYQCYWEHERLIACQSGRTINAALAQQHHSDSVHNIDRLMRFPFTVNHPNQSKIDRGYPVTQSSVYYYNPDNILLEAKAASIMQEFTAAQPKREKQQFTIPANDEHSHSKIVETLALIDPDITYPEWVNVGMGLKSTGWPDAFDLWEQWSLQGNKAKTFGNDSCAVKWASFKTPDKCNDRSITIATILDMGKEVGVSLSRPRPTAEQLFGAPAPNTPVQSLTNTAMNADAKTLWAELQSLSGTTRLKELQENLMDDNFILPNMALQGQITLIYAKPNTGKTLMLLNWLLENIRNGITAGGDILYINADDSFKDFVKKIEIIEPYGMLMVSPQEAGRTAKDILYMLQSMAVQDQVAGKVIILDTLKSFVDLMDKTAQRDFWEVAKTLTAKRATVIIAGHANKNMTGPKRDELVYEGTADTMDNVQCAYAAYKRTDVGEVRQVVEFINEKSRGDVFMKASYQYQKMKGMTYEAIMGSVELIPMDEADKLKEERELSDMRKKYHDEILFIKNLLMVRGEMNQSEICDEHEHCYIKTNHIASQFSKKRLLNALNNLDGNVWKSHRGENNARLFNLIPPDKPTQQFNSIPDFLL